MASPRFAWGIDIGNRALKAVRVVTTAEGLAIDEFDVIEHDTVLSEAGDNRETIIQTALATFVARHPGIEKGQVGVGVSAQRAFAKFINLPPVEAKKIPEIVRFEAIQQIPFPLEDVEWSYQLFQDPESPEVEVGIFAMKKELVNQHIRFFTDAKLNVQVVQMNPLAVYNAMYYDSRIKGTTMVIDIGAESTDLIIAEGETIWMRSIGIGGNNFTEALSKSFKVNFEKAEDLKRNASTSKYGRQIMQAMRPIFAELVSDIQKSIGFYNSVHKESRIGKVMAVGSTFRLPGLHRYLSQNLTLDVEKLDRVGNGSLEDPKMAAALSENLLSAAGAYGLALQVMGQGKIGSSLLPERIRREKMWSEKTKWFVGAAALFLVGVGVRYGSFYYYAGQYTNEDSNKFRDDITRVQFEANKLDKAWTAVQSAGETDRARIRNVLDLTTGRDFWQKFGTSLASALPQYSPDAQPAVREGKLDELKKIPRPQRNQIVVSAMVSHYRSDLDGVRKVDLATLADENGIKTIPGLIGVTDFGGLGGNEPRFEPPQPTGDDSAPAVTTPTTHGFLITLKLSTPSSRGVEIVEKYITALKAIPVTADRQYRVVDGKIKTTSLIKDSTTRMQAMATAFTAKQKERIKEQTPNNGTPGGPGMPGMGEVNPATGAMPAGLGGIGPAVIPDEAYFDPYTLEDVRNDTECVVVLAVELDPKPDKPDTKTGPGGTNVASADGH